MTKMLFVKSSDYWGYDAASFDDSVNFYRYSWVVPAAQYSSMSSDDQDRLFPCALFYVQGVTDNHNFLALSITESGSESKVSGMQGGKRRTRRYTLGSPAQYSVGTYALQEAPSGASTIADIQSAVESGSTSDGSFTVSEFLTDGTKIAEAVGMMTDAKSAETSEPSGSAYLPVDPTVANPATEGYSESDLITMDDFSAEEDSEEYTFTFTVYDVDTGEEIDDGEVSLTAANETEARGEAMRMLEEGGLDDEEFVLDAEGDSRLRDIRGKFMNRGKAKDAVFGEVMSQQMSGYYRTGIVGDNPPVGQNIARRNPVAKARYFIEPGVQNPNSGEWSKGPNFQQARKIAKGVAWDTVQDMGLAAETAGLPVIPNSYGENSAPTDGHGVPQWYGSAETESFAATNNETPSNYVFNRDNELENQIKQIQDEYNNLDQDLQEEMISYGESYDRMETIEGEEKKRQYYIENLAPLSRRTGFLREQMDNLMRQMDTLTDEREALNQINFGSEGLPMTTLGQSEFPVLEDSYGGNSAWESGYGVPQWYGSAEDYDAQGISKTLEEAAPVSLKKPTLMAALGLVAGIWMARR